MIFHYTKLKEWYDVINPLNWRINTCCSDVLYRNFDILILNYMERKNILRELEDTGNTLLKTLSAFDQAKINKVPFEGSWTAGQIGDHLLKSYAVVETLNGEVKPTKRAVDLKVEELKSIFLNYNLKMQSPEFILPANSIINKEALISSLEHRISLLIKSVTTLDLSKTCVSFIIPELEEMTRTEWIYFVIYHTQRHIHQLKQIQKVLNLYNL